MQNFSTDPTAGLPRIRAMLTDPGAFGKPDEAAATAGYAWPGPRRPGPRTVAAVPPRGTKARDRQDLTRIDPEETDWAAAVAAVRDRQDERAFARLFRHFAPRVKAFLMKSGAAEALAEEVTQEVMATVWHKAALFDPARASVATWVFTIARNRRIDAIRRARRPEPEELPWGPEPEPDQEAALAMQQETTRLGEAIARLPEKQRDLIERAYFGELSHSEIAEATGLPLGTIKSRIRLALERLRHQMG